MAQSRDANAAIHSPASTTVQYATAFKSTHVRDQPNQHLRSSSKIIYRFQKPNSLLHVYMSKSICHTFLSKHLYKHNNLSKHLLIQFESQQGTFFSLMVSFGVIVAYRRMLSWSKNWTWDVDFPSVLPSVIILLWSVYISVCLSVCLSRKISLSREGQLDTMWATKNGHFLNKVSCSTGPSFE